MITSDKYQPHTSQVRQVLLRPDVAPLPEHRIRTSDMAETSVPRARSAQLPGVNELPTPALMVSKSSFRKKVEQLALATCPSEQCTA